MSRNNSVEHPEDVAVSYPPMINMANDGSLKTLEKEFLDLWGFKIKHSYVYAVEWLLANTGSICFVVGSYYFLPDFDRKVHTGAAILFIVGSFLFTFASIILFWRNDCHTCVDYPLTLNGIAYMSANTMFIVGSFCFLPEYTEINGGEVEYLGIILFIVGSAIFLFAPMYDIYRTLEMREHKQISAARLVTEVTVGLAYVGGSFLFVVGSILFLPYYYTRESVQAVWCFIIGSCFFLLATLVTSMVNCTLFWYLQCIKEVEESEEARDDKKDDTANVLPSGIVRSDAIAPVETAMDISVRQGDEGGGDADKTKTGVSLPNAADIEAATGSINFVKTMTTTVGDRSSDGSKEPL
jgi:hypothetical protein